VALFNRSLAHTDHPYMHTSCRFASSNTTKHYHMLHLFTHENEIRESPGPGQIWAEFCIISGFDRGRLPGGVNAPCCTHAKSSRSVRLVIRRGFASCKGH
jgi:hypothetical protein